MDAPEGCEMHSRESQELPRLKYLMNQAQLLSRTQESLEI